MLKKTPLLLLLLVLQSGFLAGQQFDWVKKVEIKRNNSDSPVPEPWSVTPEIETDPTGNVYVTGNFKETLAFGTSSIISTGGFDIFVAKYNQNGSVAWI